MPVELQEGAGKTKGRSPGLTAPDRLKRKYLCADTPLQSATDEPESNTLPPSELK